MRLETADCDNLYSFILICERIKSSPSYSHFLKQQKESVKTCNKNVDKIEMRYYDERVIKMIISIQKN